MIYNRLNLRGGIRVLSLLLLLISARGGLYAFEAGNRFSISGQTDSEIRQVIAEWALDLQHTKAWDLLTAQVGYSFHSYLKQNLEAIPAMQMSGQSYRWWLSLQVPQSELRIGLQQINFGTAQILRPLKWFDTLQAQDPHQISKGVDALLFRHYWLNNANLWLWCVSGSEEAKGNEFIGSRDDSAEFGGRLQYPVPIGDTGVSAHFRELTDGEEYRLGLDYRYDGVVGAWLEASGSNFTGSAVPHYTWASTLGCDYVFDWRNGLALTVENHLYASAQSQLGELRQESLSSAMMLSYPLGLLDSLSLLSMADWNTEAYAVNIQWRRVYDYISIDLNAGRTSELDYMLRLMVSLNL